MKTNNTFNAINKINSLEQELIFLKQKYINKKIILTEDMKNLLEENNIDLSDGDITEVSVFDLYKQIDENEILMKKILFNDISNTLEIEYNWEQVDKNYLVNKKLKRWLQLFKWEIKKELELIFVDITKYINLEKQINDKKEQDINIEWEQISINNALAYYKKAILSEIRNHKYEEKNWKNEWENLPDYDFMDDDFWDLDESSPEIKDLVWKYNLFNKVQKSVEKWYVFTHRELQMIEDVLEDLKNGEVVIFTWDTWSWKTELAKFLCKEFMEKDYVFISWSKDLEVSDITLEKQITSKSRLSSTQNIVAKRITDKNELLKKEAKEFYEDIVNADNFKKLVLDNTSDENREDLKQELKKWDFLKKDLITEYHMMGLYLAATNGLPLIIDEVNIIRPEVFMALNDLLTKRIWDKIQLPNALWNIEVKEGFCIMLTWNDPEQNAKSWKYKVWRNSIDEASYNRLRSYAKWYFNQVDKQKWEYKFEEWDNSTLEYLHDNEMYWVILMMMFAKDSDIMSTWKYGFEIMKRDFEWDIINKASFMKNVENLSNSISMIQRAFAWETISLWWENSTISLKDTITRKVFSMRNLIQVLSKFKTDTNSFEYHIYNEFIKQTPNIDEKYSLLLVFKKYWFFWDLITDNKESSINNVDKKMDSIRNNKNSLSLDDIENKVIITKQDLYKEYFWDFSISDDYFVSNKEKLKLNNENESDDKNESISLIDSIEVTSEDLIDLIEWILKIIEDDNIDMDITTLIKITSLFDVLLSKLKSDDMDFIKDKNKFNHYLLELNNILENSQDLDSEEFDSQISLSLSNIQNESNT